jgi:CDP-glucose 4,6-dehydratase
MSINEFYNNKKILITGHTGFKGAWLTLFLHHLGAKICGISLDPKTKDDFFVVNEIDHLCDSFISNILDFNFLKQKIDEFQPDVIFHLAAQPLVRYSYINPLETFQTNVIGTANLLEALKVINTKCAVVVITTDKVYENKEWQYPYREIDRLGGKDPYSASKACTELTVSSFRHSFYHPDKIEQHGIAIATARAGNVIGGGDWSEDRLLPDIIKSISSEKTIIIRNPSAIRPWQHVLEPLYGYLLLAMNLYNAPNKFSSEWNFGPYPDDVKNVKEVVETAISILGKGTYEVNVEKNAMHEATLLRLDISKVINELQWRPMLQTNEAIKWTIEWYKEFFQNKNNIKKYSSDSILNYLAMVKL